MKNITKVLFAFLLSFHCIVLAQKNNISPNPSETQTGSSWVNPGHTSEDHMGFKDGWFIGLDVGRTAFYGDISLYTIFPKSKDFKTSLGNCGSFYFGKKFKFGLAAEAQGFIGTLKGEKRSGNLYPRYFNSNYFQYAVNAKFNLSQLIFRENSGRKLFNRLTMYITAGGGQMFFRSRLYKLANNNSWYLENATGFSTASIDSAGPNSGGGNVTDRSKMTSAFAVPLGTKINFKLNEKADVVLDLVYTTVFSDKVDAWERKWGQKDRYLHIGLGLCYNLGKNNGGDVPDDQRLFRPKDKANNKDAYDEDEGSKSSERKGLFGGNLFGGKKSSKSDKKEDRDLELRMKMYELQLKLFEMQYLMGK